MSVECTLPPMIHMKFLQRVFIIPSKKLVVVRMGLCDSGDFDFNEFLAEIIKAIPSK